MSIEFPDPHKDTSETVLPQNQEAPTGSAEEEQELAALVQARLGDLKELVPPQQENHPAMELQKEAKWLVLNDLHEGSPENTSATFNLLQRLRKLDSPLARYGLVGIAALALGPFLVREIQEADANQKSLIAAENFLQQRLEIKDPKAPLDEESKELIAELLTKYPEIVQLELNGFRYEEGYSPDRTAFLRIVAHLNPVTYGDFFNAPGEDIAIEDGEVVMIEGPSLVSDLEEIVGKKSILPDEFRKASLTKEEAVTLVIKHVIPKLGEDIERIRKENTYFNQMYPEFASNPAAFEKEISEGYENLRDEFLVYQGQSVTEEQVEDILASKSAENKRILWGRRLLPALKSRYDRRSKQEEAVAKSSASTPPESR